jgi:hypothetical protein
MKMINLKDKFEGHIVLWAKNHYGERTLERLAEIQREWSGMPNDWNPHPKHVLGFIREAADTLGVNGRQVVDSVVHAFWMENNLPTTYHVGFDTQISLKALIMAYADAIQCAVVNDEKTIKVDLPKLLPDMKYKYELERA